jgi:hypothetical protein
MISPGRSPVRSHTIIRSCISGFLTFRCFSRRRRGRSANRGRDARSRLKGRYALRLYEILMQNLTYRTPDADGMIRWPIGINNLRAWMGVDIPTKELKRNIKNAIEELRRIAGWDVILRSKGRRNAILQFATAKRVDEIRRPSAVVPSPTPEEESPVADLVTFVMQEILKADPDHPQEKNGIGPLESSVKKATSRQKSGASGKGSVATGRRVPYTTPPYR